MRCGDFAATIATMTRAAPPSFSPLTDTEADAYVAATAAALGLFLADADANEIRANFLVAHRMAKMLEDAPLGDHIEPLPVFRA